MPFYHNDLGLLTTTIGWRRALLHARNDRGARVPNCDRGRAGPSRIRWRRRIAPRAWPTLMWRVSGLSTQSNPSVTAPRACSSVAAKRLYRVGGDGRLGSPRHACSAPNTGKVTGIGSAPHGRAALVNAWTSAAQQYRFEEDRDTPGGLFC